MALMRMGRRGVNPGDDDKKKKKSNGSQPSVQDVQEVTVSASKPVRQKSTWEDVDKKEKSIKEFEAYDKAMKFYNEGPPANSYMTPDGSWKKNDGGQKISKAGKDVSGREVSLSASNDTYSASRINKDTDEAMKKDKYVSIDDPSLDITTRSLLKEATYGDEESKLYGKPSTKYVKAGTKLKTRTDVWGEEFNNKEFQDAGKSGKFDEYATKKGYGGRSFMSKVDIIGRYSIPERPKEDYRNIDINKDDLVLPKLETKKVTKISTSPKKLAISEKQQEESPEWSIRKPSKFHGTSISYSAPSLNRRKAVKGEDNVNFGEGIKTSRGMSGIKKLGYAVVANPLQKARFKSEVRQGKAYFGNYEGKSSADLSDIKKDLKDTKKEMRSVIREVKDDKALTSPLGKSERIKGYRDEIKGTRSDIRTVNKAGRYLRNLEQPSANSKITEYKTSLGEVKTINTGKIQYATPGKFEGYSDFARSKKKNR